MADLNNRELMLIYTMGGHGSLFYFVLFSINKILCLVISGLGIMIRLKRRFGYIGISKVGT